MIINYSCTCCACSNETFYSWSISGRSRGGSSGSNLPTFYNYSSKIYDGCYGPWGLLYIHKAAILMTNLLVLPLWLLTLQTTPFNLELLKLVCKTCLEVGVVNKVCEASKKLIKTPPFINPRSGIWIILPVCWKWRYSYNISSMNRIIFTYCYKVVNYYSCLMHELCSQVSKLV